MTIVIHHNPDCSTSSNVLRSKITVGAPNHSTTDRIDDPITMAMICCTLACGTSFTKHVVDRPKGKHAVKFRMDEPMGAQ